MTTMNHALVNDNETMSTEPVITGVWTKPEWEGGCSNCDQRLTRVAKIGFNSLIFRLCDDCLQSLRELLEAMESNHEPRTY